MRCYEVSSVPTHTRSELNILKNELTKEEYEGVVIQLRHIFYPKLTPKFDETYQTVEKFVLEGFHHDEYSRLEKSGLFTYVDKTYGQAERGAEECFIGVTNWGNEVICKEIKTFFPSSWSKEKVIHVILEANKNRIEDISDPWQKNQSKYLCKGSNNMLIEVIINFNNVIISAYPSKKNF